MLSCVLTDIGGREIAAPPLLSLSVNIDEGVPADSLYAVFSYADFGELTQIKLTDGEKLLFVGIVDEQEHEQSGQGEFLKISARSPAAFCSTTKPCPAPTTTPRCG